MRNRHEIALFVCTKLDMVDPHAHVHCLDGEVENFPLSRRFWNDNIEFSLRVDMSSYHKLLFVHDFPHFAALYSSKTIGD